MPGDLHPFFAVPALTALLVGASPTPAAEAPARPAASVVRPGTLMRWPGAGLESCEQGGRRFAPLDGACYYAIDLLQPKGPLTLARTRSGRRETARVTVGAFDYPVQRLTLPRSMVDLAPRDLARVQRENREIAPLWARAGERRFRLPLGPPLADLPVGGRFGQRRIINGKLRSPHSGADYGVAQGTPVLAPEQGVVALVADHFFGGRSVYLDHGDGLISMSFHLSRVLVAPGEPVVRGQRIGEVGATGRAKGPHLHFGVRWHAARVDPALLLGEPGAIPALSHP